MNSNVEPTYNQVLTVLQETDSRFDNVVKMLKHYGNTITTEKQLDKWASVYQRVLENAGFVQTKEECIEKLCSLFSKAVGFHVRFRKSEFKPIQSKHFWKLHNFNDDVIIERKA